MSKGSVEKERSVSTMGILVFSLAAIGVSACSSQKPWSVEEVTGHLPDLDFFPDGGKGAPVTDVLRIFTNCRRSAPFQWRA
ncbi:MAG TPA: hypothetical protein VJ734_05495 [Nitrosospira sp.]|nr:hypothetical protein [Nitrosospira sp.]